MGNFIDYIKWRGDISMDVSPVNDIDILALTILSYGIFEGIVDDTDAPVSIRDAAEKYRLLHPEETGETIDVLNTKTFGPYILYEMANSKRFADLKLSCYEDVFSEEESIQFSAITVELPNKTKQIIYRGTDSTIDGWREDFAISFTEVGAQKLSYEYLNKNIKPGYRYILSGHSKGGNLAEYAAMSCNDDVRALIDKIYSFDGPGICPEMRDTLKYLEVRKKRIRIAPSFSVVGMLFRETEPDVIVKSSGTALLQHSGFTWQLEGTSFLTQPQLDQAAAELDNNIDEWIKDESLEQRQAFTKEMFDAFKAGGAIDVQGIAAGGIDGIQKIVRSLTSIDEEAREVTVNLVKQAAVGITDKVKNTTKESIGTFLLHVGIWYAAISMAFGVMFLGFPTFSMNVVGIVFFAQLFFLAVFILITSIVLKKKKLVMRVSICAAFILIATLLLIIFRLWEISSGIIIAGLFLMMGSFRLFNAVMNKEETKGTRRLWFIDAGISFLLVIADLVTMSLGYLDYFLKPAGVYLVIMSMIEFFRDFLARELNVYKG